MYRAHRRTALLVGLLFLALLPAVRRAQAESKSGRPDRELRMRLEGSLDRWCRWLAGYLRPIPDTDYYTMTPYPNTGYNRYRDVAGNQFAAAAAAYWLARAEPVEELAQPLRGLIRLSLDSHIAIGQLDRPESLKWGAGHSFADNWHADLFAGTSGMLMQEGLPAEDRQKLLAILAWEADKQVEFGISRQHNSLPGRWPDHSVGEANSWSCAVLQAARHALPDAPHQAAWRETAILYSLNAISLPDDVASDEVVAGKPLSERVKGANFEPGGIQEHHGFYHPGYMGWPLAYQAYAQLLDEQLPESERNGDVYLRNWQAVFQRLKQGSFANGRFIYCAGYDWNAYGYGNAHILPIGIFAAARFRDPDAARMAAQWLRLVEHEQALGDGSIQGVRLARLKNNYTNDFAWYEAISGASLAHSLWVMDHLDTASMPPPATEDDFNARNTGTYYEPNARLVWHRTPQHWTSFSWRSAFGQWQAVVQPLAQPHLLKFNHNGMGMLGIAGAGRRTALRSFQIGTFDEGGFWSLGVIDRLADRGEPPAALVRQYVALVALADGPSIFVDQCQALEPIEVRTNGSLGLRLAADIFHDNRVKLSASGEDRLYGPHPHEDEWHTIEAESITIEDTLAMHVLTGDGAFQLLQKRQRPTAGEEMIYAGDRVAVEESLLSHELYFGPPVTDPPKRYQPQDWIRNVVAAIDCSSPETARSSAAEVAGAHPCLAIRLPEIGRVVAVNFSATEQTIDTPAGRLAIPPHSVRVK